MRQIITFSLIIFILSACSGGKENIEPFELEAPLAVALFCQTTPDDTLQRIEYQYDKDLLISETTISQGEIQRQKTFQYNSDDLLITEVSQINQRVTEKTYQYNELDQLVKIISKKGEIDNNDQFIVEDESEQTYEYENNLLVKEWASWGGLTSYEYENEKVSRRIEHTIDGTAHHFTEYKYKKDLLSEEIKTTRTGNTLYHKVFHYDARNRLDFVEDRDNVIEENLYQNKKLTEKREYYFGIDPFFYPCAGNLIYRYEY